MNAKLAPTSVTTPVQESSAKRFENTTACLTPFFMCNFTQLFVGKKFDSCSEMFTCMSCSFFLMCYSTDHVFRPSNIRCNSLLTNYSYHLRLLKLRIGFLVPMIVVVSVNGPLTVRVADRPLQLIEK